MERGAPASSLPHGIRQDTRKHTSHPLRPEPDLVRAALAGEIDHESYARRYRALVRARFEVDRAPFDHLARLARFHDVYLGCSCPTAKMPDVRRCHTWLALELMKELYPELEVVFPDVP
jgi:hypothetical protein